MGLPMIRSESIASEIVLTVLSGEEKGRIIVLGAPSPQVVGRGETADVKLSPDDPRMIAAIYRSKNALMGGGCQPSGDRGIHPV